MILVLAILALFLAVKLYAVRAIFHDSDLHRAFVAGVVNLILSHRSLKETP